MSPLTPKTPDPNQKSLSQAPFFGSKPPVQAKLTVNEPGDSFEQEADSMADKVMRKAAPVPEQPIPDEMNPEQEMSPEGPEQAMAPEPEVEQLADPSLQRKCDHCEQEDKVQRKASGDGGQISPQLAAKLDSSRGTGSALPAGTRSFMENAFGADFSRVNIHTGSNAAAMSQEIQAKAFTHGSDIYFNEGHYNPSSDSGKHLLAHELTHVIQQGKSSVRRSPQKRTTNEMIPGFAQQHRPNVSNTTAPTIQRAKIDHGTLTWADFTGKVPKSPSYDAMTYSAIADFDMSLYPFKTLTETETGTTIQSGKKTIDCEKGMSKDKKAADHPERYKAFSVNIEPDVTKLDVKSFMWQEKSWVKKWFHDPTARAAHADTFVPGCEKAFKKAQKSAEAKCKSAVKACEKAFKKGNIADYSLGSGTATNSGECKTVLGPACVSDRMSSVTYSYKNQNEVSADASALGDCATTFRQQMIDTVLEDSSTSLLNHEQRHFDITDEIAKKITTDLQAMATAFPVKEVEACGAGNAMKKANKELKSQRSKLSKKMAAIKKTLNTYQNTYDAETNHSVNVKAQDWWNDNIDQGLPKKSGKKDKFKI
ncbi:DUF4157 domain-containing protein [Chitinophaga barathri]|nr:DUF4157 domain-containing protein [Chitinophaga barathri]